MWDKEDPKMKWLHLVLKLVAAVVIFKLGVLVGEFRVVKSMVIGGGAHGKMLFRGGEKGEMGNRFFHAAAPMIGEGDVMMWGGDTAQPGTMIAPAPMPAPTAPQN